MEGHHLTPEEIVRAINDLAMALAIVHPSRFKSRSTGILKVRSMIRRVKTSNTRTQVQAHDGNEWLLLVFHDIDSRAFFDTSEALSAHDEEDLAIVREHIYETVVLPLLWPKIRSRNGMEIPRGTVTFESLSHGIGVTATVQIRTDESLGPVINEVSQAIWLILDLAYQGIYEQIESRVKPFKDLAKQGRCISCGAYGPVLCKACRKLLTNST